MAHKTLVNGTAYEISGGKTLVNGTGYSIASGKTLVGGTAYEVGFGKPVTIMITQSGSASMFPEYVKVEHNGTVYNSSTLFVAKIGDIIYCTVGASGNGSGMTATVTLNGETIAEVNSDSNGSPEADNGTQVTYAYEVIGDTSIHMQYTSIGTVGSYGTITITEIQEGQEPVMITILGDSGLGDGGIYYPGSDGKEYSVGDTIPAIVGGAIYISTEGYIGSTSYDGDIYLNGVKKGSVYTYTVVSDATITLEGLEPVKDATGSAKGTESTSDVYIVDANA